MKMTRGGEDRRTRRTSSPPRLMSHRVFIFLGDHGCSLNQHFYHSFALPGSPALDAGHPAGCTDPAGNVLTTDQRGFPRPVDGGSGQSRCDIGAFEFGVVAPVPTSQQIYLPLIVR